jgi:hypothetical protein
MDLCRTHRSNPYSDRRTRWDSTPAAKIRTAVDEPGRNPCVAMGRKAFYSLRRHEHRNLYRCIPWRPASPSFEANVFVDDVDRTPSLCLAVSDSQPREFDQPVRRSLLERAVLYWW